LVFLLKDFPNVLEKLRVSEREIFKKTAQPVVKESVEDLETEELVITKNANEGEN
jgi:hypothetical protein